MRATLGVFFALVGFGCGSTSHDVDYRNIIADLDATGSDRVVVATLDQRPDVGEEQPSWVGDSDLRGVHTRSGRPLAEDMTYSICSSLRQKGFSCEPLDTKPHEDEEQVKKMLVAAKADKILLLKLRDWRSVTSLRLLSTTLHYDVTLELFDGAGKALARRAARGEPAVEADDSVRPLDAISNAVPGAAKKLLEALLNDEKILAALRTPAKKPGEPDDSPFD